MKEFIKLLLQKTLGFPGYLFYFSVFKSYVLRWDRTEGRAFFAFLDLLPDEGVVLDIGANIGIMTSLLAKRLPGAEIHAFEPIPDNFRALERVVRFFRLSHVVLHKTALGDSEREVLMRMPIQKGVRMQGISFVVNEENRSTPGEDFLVHMVRLDDVPEIQGKSIVGIKMDVENFEKFVLLGGQETLRRNKPILYMELWENQIRSDCFEILASLDYEVHLLDPKSGSLIPLKEASWSELNFFFLPKTK